jgi:alpha-beta hydrolase superfamily lysophospholipase
MAATLTETGGYLAGTRTPLYVFGHCPARVRGAVVIVAPFAEEKKAAQRALVEAARDLTEAGWDVLRCDLSGTGDSGGEHATADLATWLADVRTALACQRSRYPGLPLCVIGLRLGAALAWLAADGEHPVDQLVLWEPVVNGESYMRQNRQRSQIRAQLTAGEGPGSGTPSDVAHPAFDFDGFAVSARLHADLAGIDLLAAPPAAAGQTLVLQISGSSRLKKPLEELAAHATAATLAAVTVEAFWSAIGLVDTAPVRATTRDWLIVGEAEREPALLPLSPSADLADDLRAEALSFASGDQRCHGVLYRMPGAGGGRAALLLHGWSGYRIGPGQLLTASARALARAGCPAYSFDFRGRGESEWAVGEASLNSMIRDAARAVPVVAERTGATAITLLGLCSGGEVALGASLSDPRVDTLALWSAPVFSGAFTLARQARRSRAALSGYWRKLFVGETWAKLLGGRLNWRLIARALSGGRSAEDAGVQDKAPDTATQMRAFEAFSGRLLFIYGGNDPETEPSRAFYREFVERTGMAHHFVEVAGSNHNYYSAAWHAEVIGATLSWLRGETR